MWAAVTANVYVKEDGRDRFKLEEIWKYSIKENLWAPLARPANLRGFMNYTLATYQSPLACIGGSVYYLQMEGGMRTTAISGIHMVPNGSRIKFSQYEGI